jgi:mannose-6-phosphate isomerase-like protein (cupin superfamily)
MIHEDERGEIYLIKGNLKENKEITLFITYKDFARGGCIHDQHDEYCIVLEGEIVYKIGKNTCHLKRGDSIIVPKSTPHFFVSKIDSVVIEYGADPEEKKKKHPEFRKMMEEINAKIKAR